MRQKKDSQGDLKFAELGIQGQSNPSSSSWMALNSQQMTSNYLKWSSSKVVIKHLSILPLILMDSGKIEKGKIIVDKVTSQKNVICDWRNNSVELCINDIDSRHDGTGNHQSDNDFGVAGAIQQRLAKEAYGDGRSTPGGSDRKSARVISNEVIDQKTEELNKRQLSDFVWAWGQFIDHDIVSTPSGDERFAIPIPEDDFLRTNKDLEFCDQPDEIIEIDDPNSPFRGPIHN